MNHGKIRIVTREVILVRADVDMPDWCREMTEPSPAWISYEVFVADLVHRKLLTAADYVDLPYLNDPDEIVRLHIAYQKESRSYRLHSSLHLYGATILMCIVGLVLRNAGLSLRSMPILFALWLLYIPVLSRQARRVTALRLLALRNSTNSIRSELIQRLPASFMDVGTRYTDLYPIELSILSNLLSSRDFLGLTASEKRTLDRFRKHLAGKTDLSTAEMALLEVIAAVT